MTKVVLYSFTTITLRMAHRFRTVHEPQVLVYISYSVLNHVSYSRKYVPARPRRWHTGLHTQPKQAPMVRSMSGRNEPQGSWKEERRISASGASGLPTGSSAAPFAALSKSNRNFAAELPAATLPRKNHMPILVGVGE